MTEGDMAERSPRQYACKDCPLHKRNAFRSLSRAELDYVADFKKGELSVDKGATVLAEGTRNPHLYTVLEGWSFRYKLMSDGRRQIVNYAMPGDLIGLQGTLMGEMQHSVEALSPMLMCVFEREELMDLFRAHPDLAYDMIWMTAREETMLDENLLSVGRRNATERLAYLLAFIAERARDVGLFPGGAMDIPITQQHLADTLGLSLVHTNKTLRKLARQKFLRWQNGGCELLDLEGLKRMARWDAAPAEPRPFL
jgi:CRP-like cAMP-binding protein